ncbi:Uracil-regulated protein 1 [Dimargaris cristalligena]|uniref:GTP cyclohydrolase N terminal-domain-containing protein n=1 Tax=Dimargaris cristalligena TaxID=215637 RepID=A0A4P9ZUW7_9FUNG|nr:Uracil-regulated protein 1 [Dimargaris cristalligena]RKP37353.1 GTP cyclohydrolase N terminal-domain-containing protein [Dimargaris cristalligena]|eukprot:RKP37353.1 GTP cyclohydrolase N terminal-domain-containing protein [Dimargaris cristalligena]
MAAQPSRSESENQVLAQLLQKMEALQVQQADLSHQLKSFIAPSKSSGSKAANLAIDAEKASPKQADALEAPQDSPTATLDPSTTSTHSPYGSRIILTTYPKQFGIDPLTLKWGAATPEARGPIVASRHPDSIRIRNAIGAYGGSYCIYRALAVAIGELDPSHLPNFSLTDPPVNIGPHPQWADPKKIVSLDPYGHLVTNIFQSAIGRGIDVRPTIAITKAHMKIAEIDSSIEQGRLAVDNVIVLDSGDLNVTKAAVEPVWYLPGVAERFGIEESLLRRALFEDTGGMYPELITRPDLKIFLPPIGGLTVYIFGDPSNIGKPGKRLTMRVHDECNGSDVFGSDICTCRPYLMFGIEEAVKEAQNGGVGIIVYFRKEGRALGEVTKYLVYNARKRQEGGDRADTYFLRTEFVAGVKDMRFQALMPDVLHWLGITKIDRLTSMSNMKYDAIVNSGIEVVERVPIPDEMIPADSRVEIDAKIADGYFTTGVVPTKETLTQTKGRDWEDVAH